MSERMSEAEQKPTTEEEKTPSTTEDQQTPSTTEEQQTTKEQEPAAPEETPAAARPADDRPLVLVTGASGYIAAHVIEQLHEKGTYRIRGTVRDASNEAKTKPIRKLKGGDSVELVSANLTSDEEWKAAVKGCTYVLHVASPFPLKSPKNEDELIRPAREGALNVLKACAEEAGSPDRQLKRVVLVSSIAAISNGMDGPSGTYSEENWSDEKELRPYEKSKLLAEKASWDFVEKLEDGKKFEFSVVCPAVVMGPALTATSASGSSLLTVSQILGNKVPGVPDIYWPGVDVRDVAAGIIAAMEKLEANGRRYLLGNEEPLRYLDLAQMVAEEFGPQGYKTPTKSINKVLLWIFSQFDESGKYVRRVQGIQVKYNISRMMSELGITPRPYKATILDTCYSLIDLGVIRKTPQYLGHPDTRPPPPPPEEEPKPEESKPEEPKTEEPKAEESKPEESKPEEPKAEESKPEESKPEEPKAEEPKTEEPKAEEPKPEESKPEEPKAEEPKPEEPKAEEPKAEETKPEEPKAEEPKAEETKPEEPKAEESKPEEPKAEEPEQKPEESKVEEPKAEDPKPEEPTPEEAADS